MQLALFALSFQASSVKKLTERRCRRLSLQLFSAQPGKMKKVL
jgi:hypothetical protein